MVAIKDMEMPSCCYECEYRPEYCAYCLRLHQGIPRDTYNISRLPNCPLVEIEERKVGKWIVKDNGKGGIYVECPFCGALAPYIEFADETVWKFSKFCHDCGAEMRDDEND